MRHILSLSVGATCKTFKEITEYRLALCLFYNSIVSHIKIIAALTESPGLHPPWMDRWAAPRSRVNNTSS
jgi:hypothetical protein